MQYSRSKGHKFDSWSGRYIPSGYYQPRWMVICRQVNHFHIHPASQINSAFHPYGVGKLSTCWDLGGAHSAWVIPALQWGLCKELQAPFDQLVLYIKTMSYHVLHRRGLIGPAYRHHAGRHDPRQRWSHPRTSELRRHQLVVTRPSPATASCANETSQSESSSPTPRQTPTESHYHNTVVNYVTSLSICSVWSCSKETKRGRTSQIIANIPQSRSKCCAKFQCKRSKD